MEKFIMAAGCAVRVRDSVNGDPVLVLLHGYLESIEVWDEFIPLLEGVRTIAVDLPGHGISEVKGPVHSMEFLARTVRGAMESLGVEKAWVAGHSMGGYVALELLRLFPQAVEGIALLHSLPGADTPEKREQREREIALVEGGKKDSLARTDPAKRFAPQNVKRFADEIEDLAETVVLTEDEGITALLRGMEQRRDNNDTLTASGAAQLFVFGRHDAHIPQEAARETASAHPRARTVWLEHSGHMGFIEEPQATAQALMEWMRRE